MLSTTTLFAQKLTEYFSPLGSRVYTNKINSLKLRSIPIMYSDKKEQKTFSEIIKEQNETILYDFENDHLVDDTALLNQCNYILNKIKNSNSNFNFDSISLYINRSSIANACCFGEGTLYINLGLFLWIDNDDELAFVIAHELSHQFLKHYEDKIKKNIALISSDDFKKEMKAITKAKDGRYMRYKNLMKDLTAQSTTHSRYKENEADSLAVILITNAGYNSTVAAPILLKLDHVEDLFTANNFYDVKNIFETAVGDSFVFKTNKKYNGLSTLSVTMSADKDVDSLKTHPDCVVRYKQVTNSKNIVETECCKAINTNLKNTKERALIEIIRYQYEKGNLTLCVHFCLFAMQNGFVDPFYNYMISLSFSKMYEADKTLEKFSVTNANATSGSTLKNLQDFVFANSRENLQSVAAYYLNNLQINKTDDYNYAQLMYNISIKRQDAEMLQQRFKKMYPNSKYNYLINLKTENN